MSTPKNALKWKTSAARKAAFAQVVEHLEAGFSKQSFPLADWETVEAYIENFPKDFPKDRLDEAMRRHRLLWERIGLEGAQGCFKSFNAPSWIFNMKNRFAEEWRDKQEMDTTLNVSSIQFTKDAYGL